jgi:hypothetical protein
MKYVTGVRMRYDSRDEQVGWSNRSLSAEIRIEGPGEM